MAATLKRLHAASPGGASLGPSESALEAAVNAAYRAPVNGRASGTMWDTRPALPTVFSASLREIVPVPIDSGKRRADNYLRYCSGSSIVTLPSERRVNSTPIQM